MSTHLYCVLPGAVPGAGVPQGLSGVDGGRVRALAADAVVAWVSDVERGLPLSFDWVRAHDAVVEAALNTGTTPVPARFGQRFDSDSACQAALERRADSVRALLDTVQGYVEMTLIIAPSTRRMIKDLEPVIPEMLEPDVPGAGRRYMEALRAREAATGRVGHATDELAARLREATSALVRSENMHETITPMPLRTISHLVRRDDVDAYKRAVGEVHRGKEFQVLVIGPRAPYSFCALQSDAGGNHGMNLAD